MEVSSPRDDGEGYVKQPLATQACETCRQRKVKCDEERPQCGVCRRLNVACKYREAKPTKKDKTLVYILDTLKSLEVKIDRAITHGPSFSETIPLDYPSTLIQMRQQTLQILSEGNDSASLGTLSLQGSKGKDSPTPSLFSNLSSSKQPALPPSYRNQIEARKLLSWPAVRQILQNDLAQIPTWDAESDGGEKWLLKISQACEMPLPVDDPITLAFVTDDTPESWELDAAVLTTNIIEELCQIYFRSFHCIFPILDARHFYQVTLPQAYAASFHQYDASSALVLLVLALGTVAKEAVSGDPILEEATGRSTGIRGGTPHRTPGLVFLNEAKRRIGFMITAYDLIVLQCFILFSVMLSVYYSQCSRNLDYWHMTALSCTLCQSLVRTVDDWKTFDSDLLARSYWMCILLEGGLTSELGLTSTGITDLENSVPLPLFLSNSLLRGSNTEEELFIEYHFLAQITLRSLLNRIHTSLRYFSKPASSIVWTTQKGLNENDIENSLLPDAANETPPTKLISELSRQLQAWRQHLPPALKWNDIDLQHDTERPNTATAWQHTIPEEPTEFNLLDSKTVLNASLRTRYKYAQYLMWRPYIYKVLHFPSAVTEEDLQGCREAFKACSLWPLTYPLFQGQRRLIPHIYEYSHTPSFLNINPFPLWVSTPILQDIRPSFFGVLTLLHVCLYDANLHNILEPSEDIERSKLYMLRWMWDMQVVHPVARWCWHLLQILYKDHLLEGMEL